MKDLLHAINEAWNAKRYDEVLSLLKRDSFYPHDFKFEDLNDHDDDQKSLKDFVGEIINLHDQIRNGNLNRVKEIIKDHRSKFYLNPEGRSAVHNAIENKQFRIYAYLKSIEVNLDEDTKNLIRNLSYSEQNNLREILRSFFPTDPILYLKSKSKTVNADLKSKLIDYYSELYEKIPTILEVVQFESELEIIFDCSDEDVIGTCLIAERADGATLPKEKTIYIASKGNEKKLLGTLAHELAHLAMSMVFKNKCKPYGESDEEGKNCYQKILKRIEREIFNHSDEAEILLRVFDYPAENFHSELIVRIPHITSQFENGSQWLQTNVLDLLDYYRTKVIPKCDEFMSQSFLIKPKSKVRNFNENYGEINWMKNSFLFFENVDYLKNFLESHKICFVITKNARLELLRVLQALYQKDYISYDNFIALKFQNCIESFSDVKIVFFSEATNSLILNCESIDNEKLKEGIKTIIDGLGNNKKIVFIIDENQLKIIKDLPKNESINCRKSIRTKILSLIDLDDKSRRSILQKQIMFQGKKMTFGRFCDYKREYFELIEGVVIEKLLENETQRVGEERFGISSLEGSYAQIIELINNQSLSNEMKTTDDVFLIYGKRQKVIKKLNLEDMTHQIDDINLTKYTCNTKNILLIDQNLTLNFKEFCKNNPHKKIYLIKMNNDDTFILEEIYNPSFYMERKLQKIIFEFNILQEMVNNEPSETFIITGSEYSTETFTINYLNIKILNVKEAKKFLEENKKVAHWFQVQGDLLIWKDSYGSIKNIRKFVNENLCKQNLINELDLITEIIDKKVVIIADEPGMGKSTTLTKLYESKPVAEKHWIIRINIKLSINIIKQTDCNDLTIRKIIYILQELEPKLYSQLNEFFLELLLNPEKKFLKHLLLAIDGFDELLDKEDRNKIIHFIQFLKDKTKCKVWITTRLHYKTVLEDELDTFALQMHPVDNPTKVQFIQKHYQDTLNLILHEDTFRQTFMDNDNKEIKNNKLGIYIKKLLNKMESIFQGGNSSIVGTSMQLNLILDNSTKYFKNWVENTLGTLDFPYLGKDFFEVYKTYTDRKYDVYFKKKNITEEPFKIMFKNRLELYHKYLAIRYIDREINLQEFDESAPLFLLLVGLVRLQGENVQFFHFTFHEFYCSQILVEYLTKDDNELLNLSARVERIWKRVLTGAQYKQVRKFINNCLQNINIKNIPRKNLDFIGAEHFLNALLNTKNIPKKNQDFIGLEYFLNTAQNKNTENKKNIKTETRIKQEIFLQPEEYLSDCIFENNCHLFDLLFWNLKSRCKPWQYFQIVTFPGDPNLNILSVAFEFGNLQILTVLLETIKLMSEHQQKQTLFTDQDGSDETTLHVVTRRSPFEILKQLLSKAAALLSHEDWKTWFTKKNYSNQNVLLLACHRGDDKIIKYLLEEAKKILPAEEKQIFFMHQNKNEENILTLAVIKNKHKLIQFILHEAKKILLPEMQQKFFIQENKFGENILLIAIKQNNYKLMNLMLEEAKKLLPMEKLQKYFCKQNHDKKNILFFAAQQNNCELIQLILEEAKKIMSSEDQQKFLMQHNSYEENITVSATKK